MPGVPFVFSLLLAISCRPAASPSDSETEADIDTDTSPPGQPANKDSGGTLSIPGLRVSDSIELGMAFRDVTLHNLDMDYEAQASGGGISTVSTNGCPNTDTLSCEQVPLPRGLCILGSRTAPPGDTIGLMSATCISHPGLLNTTVGIGYEHNLRVECSSRVVVVHSDFLGAMVRSVLRSTQS